jgi:hypothetical protein
MEFSVRQVVTKSVLLFWASSVKENKFALNTVISFFLLPKWDNKNNGFSVKYTWLWIVDLQICQLWTVNHTAIAHEVNRNAIF